MSFYSKLIATIVGLVVLIASRYGFELEGMQGLITDTLIGLLTAYTVWKVRNKPANEEQRAIALQTAQEASKTNEN